MRRGVTTHLLVSLVLSVFIIGLTFLLGSQKNFSYTSLFMNLKTDYQMESAVVLAYHELKHKPHLDILKKPVAKQMIAPGTSLTYAIRKDSPDTHTINVNIQGSGLVKSLSATISRVTGSDTPTEQNTEPPTWTITFHPDS